MLLNKVLTWPSSKLYLSYQVYLPYIVHIRTYINSRKTAQLAYLVSYITIVLYTMLYLIALSQYPMCCVQQCLLSQHHNSVLDTFSAYTIRLHWYLSPCSRLYHRYTMAVPPASCFIY